MKRNTEYTNLNVFACIASTVAMFLFIKFEELMQQSMDFTIVFCTRVVLLSIEEAYQLGWNNSCWMKSVHNESQPIALQYNRLCA